MCRKRYGNIIVTTDLCVRFLNSPWLGGSVQSEYKNGSCYGWLRGCLGLADSGIEGSGTARTV